MDAGHNEERNVDRKTLGLIDSLVAIVDLAEGTFSGSATAPQLAIVLSRIADRAREALAAQYPVQPHEDDDEDGP